MKILVLIDKLDDLMQSARPVPLTDQVRVDKEEVFDLLDQIRAAIGEDLEDVRAKALRDGSDGALAAAVSAAVKENIPEIARAVAAETGRGTSPDVRPPGAPF